MAIYSLHHSHVGKSTQAQAGTAGAHVRYITRAAAASLVMGEHMPSGPDAARAWIDEREASDRKNGRVIDKMMLALPVELDAAQRADLVRDFMQDIGGGRVSWLAGIHDRGQDAHNPHAHILLRDKDHDTGKRVIGTSEKGSTDRLREAWEIAANRALERAGLDVRIDRRSLVDQGLDHQAGIHVGPASYAIEDKGLRPVSVAQELESGRVVNWPEIDQGRTRAERQREIEAGNLDLERDREKQGGRSADLVPVVAIDVEPVRENVPQDPEPVFRVPDPLPVFEILTEIHAPERSHQPDAGELVELVPVAVLSAPVLQAPERRMEDAFLGPRRDAVEIAQKRGLDGVEGPSRSMVPVEPEPAQGPSEGRPWQALLSFVTAARDRLAALGERLDVAFGRMRDQVMKAEPVPVKDKTMDDNAAVILQAMPAAEPVRDVAAELLAAGRRRREKLGAAAEVKHDYDRSIWDYFHRRQMRGPGEPTP